MLSRPGSMSKHKINWTQLWPLLIPILILLPGLSDFPYPNTEAAFSDFTITHYPNAIFLRRALLAYRSLPLWSPDILSGHPFAPNPLSGLLYPPGWLALIFPLPFGFNLMLILHVMMGSLGLYCLCRQEGLSHLGALFAGMGFAAMPKLYAHYGAGHLTLLYAVSWTPWLLWSLRRSNGDRRDRLFVLPPIIVPAIIMALIFTADPRWAIFAGLLWLGYEFGSPALKKESDTDIGLARRLLRTMGQIFMAALLAAPLAIPLWEFTKYSTRGTMTSSDMFAFSLPVERLLGLIFPDFGGFHEWILYPGAAVIGLCLITFVGAKRNPTKRFWIIVAGISLIYSLGSQIPVFFALARLPLINLLRVPPRVLFIFGMAILILAAMGIDSLCDRIASAFRRKAQISLFSVGAFTLAIASVAMVVTGNVIPNFAWGAGVTILGLAWIGLRLGERIPVKVWFLGLLLISVIDWTVINNTLFAPRPAWEVLAEKDRLREYFVHQNEISRIYSPSYSLPQQVAADAELELADGVNPMQLHAYVSFMENASGVPWMGYGVTVPPFSTGDPTHDNAAYMPDPLLLGLLNIGFVTAEFDLEVEGLALETVIDGTRIYKNQFVKPRAWVQPPKAVIGEDAKPVRILLWEPNRINIQADGAGILILSELIYPGWQVFVDGEKGQIVPVIDLLRGVELKSGRHQIEFVFRPTSFYCGLLLWGIATLYIAFRTINQTKSDAVKPSKDGNIPS